MLNTIILLETEWGDFFFHMGEPETKFDPRFATFLEDQECPAKLNSSSILYPNIEPITVRRITLMVFHTTLSNVT